MLVALQNVDLAHGRGYQANFHRFMSEIDALNTELKHTFAGKTGLQFMLFHSAWGYFAWADGLEQVPIEFEGKAPKPAQLKELIQHARQKSIRVLFAQPQFSAKSAALVAREIGDRVV